MKGDLPSKNYTKLVKNSIREIYSFWNDISTKVIGTYPVETIILLVLKMNVLESTGVKYLYKLSKEYPGSYIQNVSGMPILFLKMSN